MRVYKRNGRYYLDYRINGRRHRKAAGTSKRQAEELLVQEVARARKGNGRLTATSRQLTLDEFIERYLAYSKAQKRSWTRDVTSTRNLSRHLGKKLLCDITAYDAEQYKNERLNRVKPATVNRELSCLKHMYTMAVNWGDSLDNPIRQVKKLPENNRRTNTYSEADLKSLLENLDKSTRVVVVFAVHTGMRRGDILDLRWQDVDLEQGMIFVRTSKNSDPRRLPMSETVREILSVIPHDSEYVFSLKDTASRSYVLRRIFDRGRDMAHLRHLRFHDLRHTFATTLANADTNLLVLQELSGHRSVGMTQRYTHLSTNMRQSAISNLPPIEWRKKGTKRTQEKSGDAEANFLYFVGQ